LECRKGEDDLASKDIHPPTKQLSLTKYQQSFCVQILDQSMNHDPLRKPLKIQQSVDLLLF